MGRNQSGYLQRQQEEKDAVMHATELLIKQFMLDTLQITMNRYKRYGFGFRRLMQLMEDWDGVRKEYRAALDPKDPEADVVQEHMDQEIAGIIKDNMELIPFAERYPELPKIRYGGRARR